MRKIFVIILLASALYIQEGSAERLPPQEEVEAEIAQEEVEELIFREEVRKLAIQFKETQDLTPQEELKEPEDIPLPEELEESVTPQKKAEELILQEEPSQEKARELAPQEKIEVSKDIIEKKMPSYRFTLKRLLKEAERNIKKIDKRLEKQKKTLKKK